MTRLLSLLLCALSLSAATRIRVRPSYSTEAVIEVDGVVNAATCTVEVSDSPTFATVLDFSNPAHGGSTACNQDGMVVAGSTIKMRLGRKGVTRQVSGKWYPMVLPPSEALYVKVVDGGVTLTETITTSTVPYGLTYGDIPPTDGNGNPAWPTLDPTVANAQTLDSETGVRTSLLLNPGIVPRLTSTSAGGDSGHENYFTPVAMTINGEKGHQFVVGASSSNPDGYWTGGWRVGWIGEKGTRYYHGHPSHVYSDTYVVSYKDCNAFYLSQLTPGKGYCFEFGMDNLPRIQVMQFNMAYATGVNNGGYDGPNMDTWQVTGYLPADRPLTTLITEYRPGQNFDLNPDTLTSHYVPHGVSIVTDDQGVDHDVFIFSFRMSQDRFAWTFAFDPEMVCNTAGCVSKTGSGYTNMPGGFRGAFNQGGRGAATPGIGPWGVQHGLLVAGGRNAIAAALNSSTRGTPYGGPFASVLQTNVPASCAGSSTAPCVPCPSRPNGSVIPASKWPSTATAWPSYGCLDIAVSTHTPVSIDPGGYGGPTTWMAVGEGDMFPWNKFDIAHSPWGMILSTYTTQGGQPRWIVSLSNGNGALDPVQANWQGAASGTDLWVSAHVAWIQSDLTYVYGSPYWDISADPFAESSKNKGFSSPCMSTNHYTQLDYANGSLMAQGQTELNMIPNRYSVRLGQNTCPELRTALQDTPWHGKMRFMSGQEYLETHPATGEHAATYPNPEDAQVIDIGAYVGDKSQPYTASRIAGTTYLVQVTGTTASSDYGDVPYLFHRVGKVFSDWSSPTRQMSDTTADAYRSCTVRKSGECYAGAPVGAIILNAPADMPLSCPDSRSQMLGRGDMQDGLCITQMLPRMMAAWESKLHASNTNQYSRAVTRRFGVPNDGGIFATARLTPFANMLVTQLGPVGSSTNAGWLGLFKMPTSQVDGLTRNTFLPREIKLVSPAGTTGVYLEFGYNWDGTTIRKTPYGAGIWDNDKSQTKFAGDTITPIACSGSCTVKLEALPDRPVYWRAKGVNSSGTTLWTGQVQIN